MDMKYVVYFFVNGLLTSSPHQQAEGTDTGEDNPLLNAAHALVGAYGVNKAMATAFVNWLIHADGGQKIIKDFAVNGEVLYTIAPPGTDPLALVKGFL